jgi:hypothetical protein
MRLTKRREQLKKVGKKEERKQTMDISLAALRYASRKGHV